MNKPITEGEKRVRIRFNPGEFTTVDDVKQMAADLIDFVYCHGKDARLTALAMTAFEEGAMWAVKSVTADD